MEDDVSALNFTDLRWRKPLFAKLLLKAIDEDFLCLRSGIGLATLNKSHRRIGEELVVIGGSADLRRDFVRSDYDVSKESSILTLGRRDFALHDVTQIHLVSTVPSLALLAVHHRVAKPADVA